ncbi:MAG: zf-HC2 domain-containing protein [Eubacteriales bacterium]|nr:zf-HC2 domain-containing protein [Eubacteriales bacterium]
MDDSIRITCGICEDLIPLVEDGIAAEESKKAVLSHIAGCAKCRNKYSNLEEKEITKRDSFLCNEKDDRRILMDIREKISIWLLTGICVSLMAGVLIVITSSSSPWLMVLVFPFVSGFVYLIGGRTWRYVPLIAAVLWIIIALLMGIGNTCSWKTAIWDSVISAVFPLVFSYIGALAAVLLKYAFKGEI